MVECMHVELQEDTYSYKLSDSESLHLCKQCNLNLAENMMKQIAIEVFVPGIVEKDWAKNSAGSSIKSQKDF